MCYANTICRTQTGTQAVAMCCISWITLHTQHKYRDTKKNTNDRGNCHVLYILDHTAQSTPRLL